MSRALVPLSFLLVTSLALVACGAPDRPAPTGGEQATADIGSPVLEEEEEDACEPGTVRECRIYFHDADGRLHCTAQSQFCGSVRQTWLPCGVRDEPARVSTPRP